MPVYGTPLLYGSARYGFDVPSGGTLDQRRRIWGGWAPWLSENVVPWRTATWEVGYTNTSFLWEDSVVGLSTGSERRITSQGQMLPEDGLTLQVADPTGQYLEGGLLAALLAPNQLVLLRCTVTTLAGALAWLAVPYRLTTGWTRTRDRWGRDVLQAQAEDWLRALVAAPIFPPIPGLPVLNNGVSSPLSYAMGMTNTQMLGNDATYLDLAQALYSVLAGGTGWGLTGRADPPSKCSVRDGTAVGGPINTIAGPVLEIESDWLRASPPDFTWAQLLESLQSRYGWTVRYGADGYPSLADAQVRYDSGYVVSTDPLVGGTFPVPWDKVTRQLSRPPYTRVEIWGAPPANIVVDTSVLWQAATSPHPDFPNTAPLGRTEYLTGGGSAQRRLWDYLGQADQLALSTESTCPPPPVGDDVRVRLPEDATDGYYAFTAATIPLSPAAASWTLTWNGGAG